MSPNDTEYKVVSQFEIDETKRMGNPEPVVKSKQFVAAIAANLASFALGTCLGWTSPVNTKLADKNMTDTPLSEPLDSQSEESAWISSIIAIGALIAPFAAGPLADVFGRKWTMISSAAFFCLAYILLVVTKCVPLILVARFIQGLGVGFVMTVTPMYCGEIATDDCRGAIGSLMQLFIVGGILYVYAIGPYVSYWVLQWACFILPIIFAVSFYFMPDSPHFYLQKGRYEDAKEALKALRGQSDEGVQEELDEIQGSVKEAMQNKGSFKDIIQNKGNLKALIICCGLISFQQLSGINVVLFNSQTIFEKAETGLEPAVAAILVGVVQVLASGATPILADRLGRRIILLTSAGVMSIGLIALGAYFYILNNGDPTGLGWLPVLSLIVYVIVYCVGFGPLPWAVLGEMFPGNVKPIASSIVASNCWVLGFVVTKFYPNLDKLGPQYAFWLFGGLCVVAFAFVFTVLIETKGLSLKQIQEKLNS